LFKAGPVPPVESTMKVAGKGAYFTEKFKEWIAK
jgi:hypothetical protein